MRDGAFRVGGDTWATAIGTPTSFDLTKDTGTAGLFDPSNYDSLEGDNVMEIGVDAAGDGQENTIQAQITNNKPYHVTAFVRAGNAGAAGGTVSLAALGSLTAAVGAATTLSQTLWKPLSLFITFDVAETTARVRIKADTTFTGLIWVDGVHVSPSFTAEAGLGYEFVGSMWQTELEYADIYRDKAQLLVSDLAASCGGWTWERGNGNLVFESYDRRDPAVVLTPKLRLSDEPSSGLRFQPLPSYEHPVTAVANTVRVGSLGQLWPLGGPTSATGKYAWSLEGTLPVSIAQDERRVFFAHHVAEEQGASAGLIARRTQPVYLPVANWQTDSLMGGVQTPYVLSYGRGSDVVVKGKSSGGAQGLYLLSIACRPTNRQGSEWSYFEFGSGADPVMELEMPCQGLRTAIMNNVANWAFQKYNAKPATIEPIITAGSTEELLYALATDVGDPVWFEHTHGKGAFGLNALFYTEGIAFDLPTDKGEATLQLTLEQAT
jgi:hypothetical protein